VRLSSLSGAPSAAWWKRWKPCKDTCLGLDFLRFEIFYDITTRRPLPPMVVSNLQPLCGVSALLGGIEKTL